MFRRLLIGAFTVIVKASRRFIESPSVYKYQDLYEGVPHLDGAAAVLLAAGVVQQVPLRGPEV